MNHHAIALACVLAAGAGKSAAQMEQAERALPEVSVTAKGYASGALETPAATETLGREAILQTGEATAGGILGTRPGVAVHSDGAWGQNPVLRGLKKESTVLLVDGMRLNAAQPAGALASFVDIGLLEQADAVKGPSSVRYGTGALGGVLDLRTPQARFRDRPGTDVETYAYYGSAERGIAGSALLRAGSADHAGVLGVSGRDAQDYRAPDGTVARTGYSSWSALGQYRARLGGGQQLRFSAQQYTVDDVWYPGSRRAPAAPPGLGTVMIHSPTQERRLIEAGWSREGAEGNVLDARLYRQEIYREIAAYSEALGRDRARTRVTFATDGADFKGEWAPHRAHFVTYGVNLWRMTADPERHVDTNPPAYNNNVRMDPFSDGEIESAGAFLQDEITLGAMTLFAGARLDRVTGSAASKGTPPVTTGLERTDQATSWTLGGIWRIAPALNPYVNVAQAFRAADMRERFEDSERGDGYYYIGNPQLRPETGNNLEIGLKGASGAWSYTLAAYHNRIEDYITGRVTGAVQPGSGLQIKQTENLGRVTISGLEAEVRWALAKGQQVSAGFSALRGDNEIDDEPLYQMPADRMLLGWQGAVHGDWRADALLTVAARQDRVATRFSNGLEDATPGYTTFDIGLTAAKVAGGALRITVRNVFDERYHDHLAEGLPGQEVPAPGRSLQLTWKGTL